LGGKDRGAFKKKSWGEEGGPGWSFWKKVCKKKAWGKTRKGKVFYRTEGENRKKKRWEVRVETAPRDSRLEKLTGEAGGEANHFYFGRGKKR